jgi:hypothetical protein
MGVVIGLLYYSIFPPSFWLMGFWRYNVAPRKKTVLRFLKRAPQPQIVENVESRS